MIEAISAVAASAQFAPAQTASATNGVQFANVFEQQVQKVNADLSLAETSLQKLAAGEQVALHDVMIALETARIGVQTMVQVRNKFVEAYQDLMRMQI
ncbi:MAG: flagellar hook-basal body complex protein FliE [Aquabacterium sp.]